MTDPLFAITSVIVKNAVSYGLFVPGKVSVAYFIIKVKLLFVAFSYFLC